MSQPLFIHFLNGPLQRQSLLLPEGDIICGTSSDADFIVPLTNEIPRFVLTRKGKILYRADEMPCQMNGQILTEQGLPSGVPAEIAGCRFFYSDQASPVWPDDRASEKKDVKAVSGRSFITVAMFLYLLMVALAAFFLTAMKPQTVQVDAVSQIQLWLESNQKALTDLNVTWGPDGKAELRGYYPNQQTIKPLLQRLKYFGISYQLLAFSETDLHEAVSYLASLVGYSDLRISRGTTAGSVDISGAIIADNTWRTFLHSLQELEGLKRWEIKNLTVMNTQELLSLVKELKLLGMVSIERHKQVFTITGLLSEKQRVALNDAIKKLTGGNTERISFQNMAPANASDALFPTPVVSVGGSKAKPFIELADGSRLQPGAKLANNYEIVAIDASRGIDLLGNDQLLHYTFNF